MCVCVCVREREREYRLSEHSLSVEMGRHKQSWRARELRLCSLLSVCVCVCVERERIGLYPLKIEIQKRCVQFWHHLHRSDPDSIRYKALLANETSAESHPVNMLTLQLVHKTQLSLTTATTPKPLLKKLTKI